MCAVSLIPFSSYGADITVKVSNLTNGIYYTPLLIAAHNADTKLFQTGAAASANLKAMAEGGSITGLIADMEAISATVAANPAGGPLAPGNSTEANLNTDNTSNTHLSIVAMLLPTNDGFMGLNAIQIPTAAGTYTWNVNAYDAGTEANDELLTGGGAPSVPGIPADPGQNSGTGGSGVTNAETNKTIHIHRGNIGDTNPTGGVSDVNSTVHRWLNPVARVTVTVK